MDVLILCFFLFLASITSFLGSYLKNSGLGGLGAICFVLLGFSFLLTGVDVQVQNNVATSLTAADLYSYDWNTTFNTSSLTNITTIMSKVGITTYTYVNETTEYTRLFSLLSIFIGLAIGFEAMASRGGKPE